MRLKIKELKGSGTFDSSPSKLSPTPKINAKMYLWKKYS
jgi:hypothetical protein